MVAFFNLNNCQAVFMNNMRRKFFFFVKTDAIFCI